jgi:hypothetical protein
MALYLGKDLVSAHSGLGGATIKNQDITVTENGKYTADSGYTGLGVVKVDVQPNNQDKNITANGTYRADSGYTGLGEVVVAVPPTPPNNQDITVKENGTYTADEGYTGLGTVTVEVPTGGGKLMEVFNGTVTELTKADLADMTQIKDYVFADCGNLTTIEIPDTVTSIGSYAFRYCTSLKTLTIPDSVTTLKSSVCGQSSFESITVGKGLTELPFGAFRDANKTLTSVTLHEGIKTIDAYAFHNCALLASTGLDTIIPQGVTKMGSDTFNGCKGLTGCVRVPASLKTTSYRMFANSGLTSAIFEDGCTRVESEMFKGCTNLASVDLPNSISSLGSEIFNGCASLTSIKVPPNISGLYSSAFGGCTSMKTYDFTSHTRVPSLSNTNVFTDIPSDCQIRVPASLYDAWIAATNWSNYADYIVAV